MGNIANNIKANNIGRMLNQAQRKRFLGLFQTKDMANNGGVSNRNVRRAVDAIQRRKR